MEYALLGIHGDVARVRMFVHPEEVLRENQIVDEDFVLPELLPGVTPTLEIYQQLLDSDIRNRLQELRAAQ